MPRRGAARWQARRGEGRRGFAEKAFFEYHLYTLGRTTTLAEQLRPSRSSSSRRRPASAARRRSSTRARPAATRTTAAPMTDRNFGVQSNKKVDVYLRAEERRRPTAWACRCPPARSASPSSTRPTSSLEFIGEDLIDHTARDETVQVKLGSAFDVVGERKQVDFRIDTTAKWIEEDIEVKVRNQKPDETVTRHREGEPLPLEQLVDHRKTHQDFTKDDSRTIHLPRAARPEGRSSSALHGALHLVTGVKPLPKCGGTSPRAKLDCFHGRGRGSCDWHRHVKFREEKFGGVLFETRSEKVYTLTPTAAAVVQEIAAGRAVAEIAPCARRSASARPTARSSARCGSSSPSCARRGWSRIERAAAASRRTLAAPALRRVADHQRVQPRLPALHRGERAGQGLPRRARPRRACSRVIDAAHGRTRCRTSRSPAASRCCTRTSSRWCERVTARGSQLKIETNGHYLTPENCARLKELGVKAVQVSLDGATQRHLRPHARARRVRPHGRWHPQPRRRGRADRGQLFARRRSTSTRSARIVDLAFELGAVQLLLGRTMFTGNAVKAWRHLEVTDAQYDEYFRTLAAKRDEYRGRMRVNYHEAGLLEELRYRLRASGGAAHRAAQRAGEAHQRAAVHLRRPAHRSRSPSVWANFRRAWHDPRVARFVEELAVDPGARARCTNGCACDAARRAHAARRRMRAPAARRHAGALSLLPLRRAAALPAGRRVGVRDRAARSMPPLFWSGFGGVVLSVIGVEAFNEYFDAPHGNRPRVQSRGHPAHRAGGVLDRRAPRSPRALAVGIYLPCASAGRSSPSRSLGGAAAIFYEAPPIRWSYRGLGELVIALSYGPWMVLGSLYLHTRSVSWARVRRVAGARRASSWRSRWSTRFPISTRTASWASATSSCALGRRARGVALSRPRRRAGSPIVMRRGRAARSRLRRSPRSSPSLPLSSRARDCALAQLLRTAAASCPRCATMVRRVHRRHGPVHRCDLRASVRRERASHRRSLRRRCS